MAPVPENVWDRTEHILSILNGTARPPAALPRPIPPPRLAAPALPRSWRDTADGILAQLKRSPGNATDTELDFGPLNPDDLEPVAPPSDSAFAPHPWPAPEDPPPRVVAVLPHRGDRTIADEILARIAETEGAQNEEQSTSFGVPNFFGFIGSAQAQSRSSRGARQELTPGQHAQLRYLRYLQRQIQELDKNNRELTSIQPEGYVPSWEELRRVEGVLDELRVRTAENERIKQGGETLQTIIGDAAHRDYPNLFGLGDGWKYNRRFPSGNRPDAVHDDDAEIRELKPNNEEAIRRGEKQLKRYVEEFVRLRGKPPATKLDLYDFYELLKRYLGIFRGSTED